MANAIPPGRGLGDLDKVIWLGFLNGYLESNQGGRGDVPYCILVVFSTAPPFRQLVRGCPSSPGHGGENTLFYRGVLLINIVFYDLTITGCGVNVTRDRYFLIAARERRLL